MPEFTHLDLQKARKTRNLPRWQLALKLGVSEDTLERWETGKQIPTPDDVGHIETALDARCEMLWERWMYSNVDSYRERHARPQITGLLAAIVSAKVEIEDVTALFGRLERDGLDEHIDDPVLLQQSIKEIDEAQAALTRLRAQIEKH